MTDYYLISDVYQKMQTLCRSAPYPSISGQTRRGRSPRDLHRSATLSADPPDCILKQRRLDARDRMVVRAVLGKNRRELRRDEIERIRKIHQPWNFIGLRPEPELVDIRILGSFNPYFSTSSSCARIYKNTIPADDSLDFAGIGCVAHGQVLKRRI